MIKFAEGLLGLDLMKTLVNICCEWENLVE